jgi:hypothetical protein
MAKDRANDDVSGAPKAPAKPVARTALVKTPFGSDEDNFVPGAPTRLQPTPVHTATRVSVFDDSDEETVTNLAVSPNGVLAGDPLDDVAVDVDVDGDGDGDDASGSAALRVGFAEAAPVTDVGEADFDAGGNGQSASAPKKNPFRDAPTQVDLASHPSEAYAISAEDAEEDDTDSHMAVVAADEKARDEDALADFVNEIAGGESFADISDLPTAAHATPLADEDDAADAPLSPSTPLPPPSTPSPPVAKTMASAVAATPPTEIEDEGPVGLARWRVVPTGWEAQPSYYSPSPPTAPKGGPQKVHTVMWNIDAGAPVEEPAAPTVTAFGDDQPSGRFRDATGANQLASVYITDALRALDDLAALSQGLEPESRRAMHAGLFGVAQKLRRAMSLLDAEKPEGDEPG